MKKYISAKDLHQTLKKEGNKVSGKYIYLLGALMRLQESLANSDIPGAKTEANLLERLIVWDAQCELEECRDGR